MMKGDVEACVGNRTGVFCGSCLKDFVPRGENDICTACNDKQAAADRSTAATSVSVAVIFLIVAMGLTVFLFVRYGKAIMATSARDNESSKLSTVLKLGKRAYRAPYVTVCRDLLTCKLRIILGYMQVR
jgi:hypothetical protein